MSTETVNIIINESGAAGASRDIHAIGPAALEAHAGVEALNSGLEQLKTLLIAAGLSFGLHELIEVAERYDTLAQKLRLTATSAQELADKEEALFAISQRTFQSFEGITDTFLGLNKAVVGLGGSYQDTLEITENVAKAMTISGKSAEEARQAMSRLAMAIQTGHTDARVFMTLFRSMPELALAVGKAMNMSAGEFRHALEAGTISSKQLVDAMQRMGASGTELDRKFQALELNITRAWTNLGNAVLRYVGQADQGLGATHLLAMGIDFMSKNINIVMPIVSALAVGITVLGVAMVGTSARVGLLMTALAANRWGLILAAVAMATSLFLNFSKAIQVGGPQGVSVMAILVAAFNTLKFAVEAVWNGAIKPFFDWLMTINPGSLTAGILAFAAALTLLSSVKILGWIASLGMAFFGLLAAILPTTIALGAWVAGVIIASAIVLKFTDAIGLTTGGYERFSNGLSNMASSLREKFTSALHEASEELKRNALASKEWSGSFDVDVGNVTSGTKKVGGAMKQMADETDVQMKIYGEALEREQKHAQAVLRAMGQDAAAAGMVINEAWKHMANDPNAGLKAFAQRQQEAREAQMRAELFQIEEMKRMEAATAESSRKTAADLEVSKKAWDDLASHVEADGRKVEAIMSEMNQSLEQQMAAYGLSQAFGGQELSTPTSRRFYEQKNQQTAEIDKLSAQIELMKAQGVISGTKNDQEIANLEQRLSVLQAREKVFEVEGAEKIAQNFKAVSNMMFYNAIAGAIEFGNGTGGFGTGGVRQDVEKFLHFAPGGSFMVGGQGSTDSQLVQFMASPDERVDVLTPAQQKQRDGGKSGSTFHVNVSISGVKDTSDWRRSEKQVVTSLLSKLNDAQRTLDNRR